MRSSLTQLQKDCGLMMARQSRDYSTGLFTNYVSHILEGLDPLSPLCHPLLAIGLPPPPFVSIVSIWLSLVLNLLVFFCTWPDTLWRHLSFAWQKMLKRYFCLQDGALLVIHSASDRKYLMAHLTNPLTVTVTVTVNSCLTPSPPPFVSDFQHFLNPPPTPFCPWHNLWTVPYGL